MSRPQENLRPASEQKMTSGLASTPVPTRPAPWEGQVSARRGVQKPRSARSANTLPGRVLLRTTTRLGGDQAAPEACGRSR